MKKIISIIIPTYNERRDIQKCIKSLKEQSFKNFEIIVVDDGSTDKTIEVVKEFKDVKILKQNHKGPGLARNLGARNARGEILIFVDSDMTFDKNYLKNLIKPLEDKKREVVGTTHELEIVENIENIWSRCWGKIRVDKKQAKKVKVFRAIRKNKFFEMGGFDARYGYADDQTFWFKYKVKPVVAENTICYHKNPDTLKGVYKQSRWISASHDYFLLNIPFVNLIWILMLIILSPSLIPLLSLKKCHENKDWILPYMLIFMTARYFGTLSGYINKVIWKINVR